MTINKILNHIAHEGITLQIKPTGKVKLSKAPSAPGVLEWLKAHPQLFRASVKYIKLLDAAERESYNLDAGEVSQEEYDALLDKISEQEKDLLDLGIEIDDLHLLVLTEVQK